MPVLREAFQSKQEGKAMTDETVFHIVRMTFHEEKDSPTLTELPERLKEQVQEELKRLKQNYLKAKDNDEREAILADTDALLAASEDLLALRLNKILRRAEYSARADSVQTDSLTEEERILYLGISSAANNYLKVQP